MINYLEKRKKQGFKKRSFVVHNDDYAELKKLADELRKNRLQGVGVTLDLDLIEPDAETENDD